MFKKEDFRNGMVVMLDTGQKRMYWDEKLINPIGYIPIDHYDEKLKNIATLSGNQNIDVIYVLENVVSYNDLFSDEKLKKIWSRY